METNKINKISSLDIVNKVSEELDKFDVNIYWYSSVVYVDYGSNQVIIDVKKDNNCHIFHIGYRVHETSTSKKIYETVVNSVKELGLNPLNIEFNDFLDFIRKVFINSGRGIMLDTISPDIPITTLIAPVDISKLKTAMSVMMNDNKYIYVYGNYRKVKRYFGPPNKD